MPLSDSLLAENRATALAALAHQDTPFEKVVEALKVHRDLSYSPIFQVMLSFVNRTRNADGATSDVVTERIAIPQQHALFELDWQLRETDDGVAGFLIYAADLFGPARCRAPRASVHSGPRDRSEESGRRD